MPKPSTSKIASISIGIIALGLIVAAASGVFNNQFSDNGIDVRNTVCEQIASARQAVDNEFEQRQQSFKDELSADKEKASDEFWAQNQQLESQYHQCISAALTADPCKDAFERIGQLYEEIMADFDAGKGFNEAKFNQREEVKKEYNDCVANARKPEFYKDKEAACDAALAAGKEANQKVRQAAEQAAQAKYDAALATATNARQQKQAILDAIEEKCKEPGGNTNVNIGSLDSAGTGTVIKSGSPACTGVFEGNNPDLRKKLNDLENQLQKAKISGLREGLYGSDRLQQAVDDARQELIDSGRSCQTDADCGDPTPVSCSNTQVGRLFCSNGSCASEQTDCPSPENCTGKPASCVDPSTRVQQQDGVYISRTIPQVGACSQNLQVLNLQKGSVDADRFDLTGNIPNWLHITPPSGKLPANTNVTYDCNTVQAFGPGTYTANGSIQIYDPNRRLINTIPFNVSITVTPATAPETIKVIQYGSKYIPLNQVHSGTGSECDKEEHWHANAGSVTATDGTVISDPNPSGCGFGKTSAVPVISVPKPAVKFEVKGLEGLK